MQPLLVKNRSRLVIANWAIVSENRAFLRICGNDNSNLSVFLYWKDDVNAQPAVEINIACSESNRGVAPLVTTSDPIFNGSKNMQRSIFSNEDTSTIFKTDPIGDRYW